MDEIIVESFVKTIIEKFTEPLINKIGKITKNEWEKNKINLDFAFTKYLKNSVKKYKKIKTILYRTEPKDLKEFFECPNLQKEKGNIISGESINNIIDISNFIIIQGTGGIGKSTLLKYLFLDEIEKEDFIPVFIELKDLNSMDSEYDINQFFFQKLYDLGCNIDKEYIDYSLRSGCFIFLLDGYDEITVEKRDEFFLKFSSFCDKYSDNYYIISSRPYTEFVEFQRFSVLELLELNKEQAISLIGKIEYDNETKQQFITKLDESLYDKYQSFASNPLLLNIMLLTYDNYADIPEKLHLFYQNAFETLYFKHDATKAGFHRELRCSIPYDSFRRIFAHFCFRTYYQNKYEFTYEEIFNILKDVTKQIKFVPESYIYDLINSICVIYKDGLKYKFTHRSFQEYFSAIFLMELNDDQMGKIGISLIEKDFLKASDDSVFPMLRDMAQQRFEKIYIYHF